MISEKYGIVTGASRGLGAAIAEELAREGYDLIITYTRNGDKAEEVKARLEEEFHVKVVPYQLAAENEQEVVALRSWAEEQMGTNLAVLVNNAGVYINKPGYEIEAKEFDNLIDVNVKGPFYMIRYFCDMMIDNHFGKIINLCSAAGLRAAPGAVAYSSSKFAVRGMTQAYALDLGKFNIQVNAIAPGSHKTDMYWDAVKADPVLMESRVKGCPLQRAGQLTEMHHIVRYFMSSDFITGQVVSMNGGTTMV